MGNSSFVTAFNITLDNATLQAWGSDDSVIDNAILAHSPLFEKE
jgi:hypothetical protein